MGRVTHQDVSVLEADPVFRLLVEFLEHQRLELIKGLAYNSLNSPEEAQQARGKLLLIDELLAWPDQIRAKLKLAEVQEARKPHGLVSRPRGQTAVDE